MKHPRFFILLTTLALAMKANGQTNDAYFEILDASNDVSRVVGALPDVEKLWPQEPETYIRSVNQAAHVLATGLRQPEAKQAFLNLFTSVMQKPCPTNASQARVWIETKQYALEYCFNFNEIRNYPSRWLDVARFIGEIRSRIIPNYQPRGVVLDIAGQFPQETINKNEQNKAEDYLQASLRRTNKGLTSFLKNYSHYFPLSNPTNAEFLNKISDAAHLTAEERAKF